MFFPAESGLRPEGLRPARGVAASGLPPLRKIPHCCLPQESGPYLSPNVAGRPLSPATHRGLGGPSPRLLPNGPRPHPPPPGLRRGGHAPSPRRPVLAAVSGGCPGAGGRLVTCYSPVRHFIPTSRVASPFDLHVLGTPPAFILSQDQTLRSEAAPEGGPLDLGLAVVRYPWKKESVPPGPSGGRARVSEFVMSGRALARPALSFGIRLSRSRGARPSRGGPARRRATQGDTLPAREDRVKGFFRRFSLRGPRRLARPASPKAARILYPSPAPPRKGRLCDSQVVHNSFSPLLGASRRFGR